MGSWNSGIAGNQKLGARFRPHKWSQKGRIGLKRHITRLKSRNLRFWEFLEEIPDNF